MAYPQLRQANRLVGGSIAACCGTWAFVNYSAAPSRRRLHERAPAPTDYDNNNNNTTTITSSLYHRLITEPLDALTSHANDRFVANNLLLSGRNISDGRYWTVLSHTLTHVSFSHLLFNMVCLWSFGRGVAMRWGSRQYVTLWVGSGAASAFASLYGERERPGIRKGEMNYLGASGAVGGIMAASVCAAPGRQMLIFPLPIPVSAWVGLTGFAAYSIYAENNQFAQNTGHLGHLGGMAFGIVWYFLRLRGR